MQVTAKICGACQSVHYSFDANTAFQINVSRLPTKPIQIAELIALCEAPVYESFTCCQCDLPADKVRVRDCLLCSSYLGLVMFRIAVSRVTGRVPPVAPLLSERLWCSHMSYLLTSIAIALRVSVNGQRPFDSGTGMVPIYGLVQTRTCCLPSQCTPAQTTMVSLGAGCCCVVAVMWIIR